jgi:hypothetical protein
MRKMASVYIAGPYSDPSFMKALENMKRGMDVGAQFIKLGFSVFDPFLDFMLYFFQNITREEYLAHSLEQVSRQDILYVLNGWETSDGTRKEIQEAKECCIPTFYESDLSPEGVAIHLLEIYNESV